MFEFLLVIDVITVLGCAFLLVRHANLNHSHPATIYLVFHLMTVTLRLAALAGGADLLFDGPQWGWGVQTYEPVSVDEITRAAITFDIGLLALSLGWLSARSSIKSRPVAKPSSNNPRMVSRVVLQRVVIIALPLGILGLITNANIPGFIKPDLDFGEWEGSSWASLTVTWIGLSLLLLIYKNGLRWYLMFPFITYLFIMSLQGYARFRLIIPVILLFQIYLDRSERRWPPLRLVLLLVVLGLAFFPLKTIGRMAQEQVPLTDILDKSITIIESSLQGNSELVFLDQYAATLSLVDNNKKFYLGATYLPLLTSPIPRHIWPDKPSLNQYQHEIARPWRPVAQLGMVPTLLGESYANFGNIGILVVPFLFAFVTGKLHARTYVYAYGSIAHLSYLLLSAVLIQVYRDGLISIFIHIIINMLPISIVLFFSALRPVNRHTLRTRYTRSFNAVKH